MAIAAKTRAKDSEQQPTLASLLKSPSYLTDKHEHILSCTVACFT